MNKPLTIRQERFCEGIAVGMTGAQAYLKAGAKVSAEVAKVGACKWLTRGNVQARIAELRKTQTKTALLTIQRKREILAEIVETPIGQLGPESPLCAEYVRLKVSGGARGKLKRGRAPSGNEVDGPEVWQIRLKGYDKLRAIELDSKLAGHFEPAAVVVESGPSVLDRIRERAERVVSALDRSAELRRRSESAQSKSTGSNGGLNDASNCNPHSDGNEHHPAQVGLSRWKA